MTLNANSNFNYQIDTNASPSIGADLLYGDALALNNAILTLSDVGSSFAPTSNKFTLIAYDGPWSGGTFSGYADDSLFTFAGSTWLINYNDTAPGANFQSEAAANGNLFVTITAIPEPSTFIPAVLGVVALAFFAWRQQRQSHRACAKPVMAISYRTE